MKSVTVREVFDTWGALFYTFVTQLQLLTRVFGIIREKNPEMATGEKKKIVMRPPQVLRAGARRTSFANFAEISRM